MEVKILRLVVTHSCSHGYYTPLKFEFHYCEIPSQGLLLFPKLHLPSRNLHYAHFRLQTSITNLLSYRIIIMQNFRHQISRSRSSISFSFLPPTKIRIRIGKKNPRAAIFITRQSSNPDFLPDFLYYLWRDDFTKLNFCRPTVNNDNSRPSLSAPAEARRNCKLWLF